MLKEIICLVFSLITGIGGVLLTGLPQYVMPHIHWPDFGFLIGVYTGLVLLVLVGVTIFAFCFSIYPGLVFLCATLSFVLTTILVNLTYYHISFYNESLNKFVFTSHYSQQEDKGKGTRCHPT